MSATIDRVVRCGRVPCGFTLVEVLVILAILSLMAGIVFPSVEKALRRADFADAARRVELGLRSARATAIEQGQPVRFRIARDGHTFFIADRSEQLPDAIRLTSSDPEIVFFADGSASGGTIDMTEGALERRLAVRVALGLIEPAR